MVGLVVSNDSKAKLILGREKGLTIEEIWLDSNPITERSQFGAIPTFTRFEICWILQMAFNF